VRPCPKSAQSSHGLLPFPPPPLPLSYGLPRKYLAGICEGVSPARYRFRPRPRLPLVTCLESFWFRQWRAAEIRHVDMWGGWGVGGGRKKIFCDTIRSCLPCRISPDVTPGRLSPFLSALVSRASAALIPSLSLSLVRARTSWFLCLVRFSFIGFFIP
jgi:hypothetical protein